VGVVCGYSEVRAWVGGRACGYVGWGWGWVVGLGAWVLGRVVVQVELTELIPVHQLWW